jgi:hypothetical protein
MAIISKAQAKAQPTSNQANLLVLDFGNGDIKFLAHGKHGYFRHAIASITESQWYAIVGRNHTPPEGYIGIKGADGLWYYYAIGDAARRYLIKARPQGASRYTADYYGVGLCYAMGEAFAPTTRKVQLFASHAPRDIEYADDLKTASGWQWEFITWQGTFKIRVDETHTFDEPFGGFCHAVMTKQGGILKNSPYLAKQMLVVDAGSYTVDTIAVDRNMRPDLSTFASTVAGVTDVFESFERELRSLYKKEFKGVGAIDVQRLEAAILSGQYHYGNRVLDCQSIADASLNGLVNDVLGIIQAQGGAANYDAILLTGGGSALIADKLRKGLPDISFDFVEPNRELMRFGNVFGGAKLHAALVGMGAI